MFENKQDTTILRDSLIAAASYLQGVKKSKGNSCATDEEAAVQIVVSSVKSFTCNLYEIDSFLELFKNQKSINSRFHAVIFINLLKSQNITSSEASSFYQSVLRDLPILNWSFYIRLNFACHWSEYFMECAKQLQPEVLSTVLNKLLEVQFDGELKYYVWHLVLQTLILKTFAPLNVSNQQYPFQFHFTCSETSQCEVKNNPKKDINLSAIYTLIIEKLAEESKNDLNVNFLKVIIHGLKTLFKLVSSAGNENEICLEQLELLTPILVKCLTQEAAKDLVCEHFSQSDINTIGFAYQILSWEVNMMYLIFVFQNSWKDVYEKLHSAGLKNVPKKIAEYSTNLLSHMELNSLSYDILLKMIEKCLKSSKEVEETYFILQLNVIKYHYPYTSSAAEYLLMRPNLWNQYDVLNLLEENVSLLEPLETYSFFIDIIPKLNAGEKRDRLLKMFFLVLSKASSDIYNLTLEKILKKWGYCDYFVPSDFKLSLHQISRRILTEVENFVLPLFVQSPFTVLKVLIEEVIKQGPGGTKALQVLKKVPVVCLYQGKIDDVPPLIDILSVYFQEGSTILNAKNFFSLLKTIMEIQVTEDILSFDLFFEICIVPNLSTNNLRQREIALEGLNVALDVLISKHALEISSLNFEVLIRHLSNILEYCIEKGNGKLKETTLKVLELLSKFKKRPDLDSLICENLIFKDKEEVVLYILGIFFKHQNSDKQKEVELLEWKNYVVEKNLDYMWIWCALTEDTDTFVDKIATFDLSYMNLLKTLTPLLKHFTQSEWINSTKLIMYYLYVLKPADPNYPWLFPANDPELYAVFRCLLDCFNIMMEEKSYFNISYVPTCLTNSIMPLMTKGNIPPSLMLNMFLDICQLSTHLEAEIFYSFSSFLTSLRKQILILSDSTKKVESVTLMELGFQCVPESKEKESLKEKIISESSNA